MASNQTSIIGQLSAMTHLAAMLPVMLAVHALPGLQDYPPCRTLLAWISALALVLLCWLGRAWMRGRELLLAVERLQAAVVTLEEERDSLIETMRCQAATHAQELIAWQAKLDKVRCIIPRNQLPVMY
jgi:hypothetical protein